MEQGNDCVFHALSSHKGVSATSRISVVTNTELDFIKTNVCLCVFVCVRVEV